MHLSAKKPTTEDGKGFVLVRYPDLTAANDQKSFSDLTCSWHISWLVFAAFSSGCVTNFFPSLFSPAN